MSCTTRLLATRLLVIASASTLLLRINTVAADGLSTTTPSTKLSETSTCPAEAPADPSRWQRSLALGFSYTDGNSNTSFFNVAGSIKRDFEANIWEFKTNYAFAESDDDASEERETTKNEFTTSASYKRVLDDRWFIGFGSDFRYDEVADIDYRVSALPTVGYFLVRDDDLDLSIEGGPGYVFERVGNEDDSYLAPRFANKFEWRLSPTAKVFESTEILFDASNSDNYIINGELGVEASLNSSLALVFVVRDAYDNQPAQDRERNDVAVVTSLKVAV